MPSDGSIIIYMNGNIIQTIFARIYTRHWDRDHYSRCPPVYRTNSSATKVG